MTPVDDVGFRPIKLGRTKAVDGFVVNIHRCARFAGLLAFRVITKISSPQAPAPLLGRGVTKIKRDALRRLLQLAQFVLHVCPQF